MVKYGKLVLILSVWWGITTLYSNKRLPNLLGQKSWRFVLCFAVQIFKQNVSLKKSHKDVDLRAIHTDNYPYKTIIITMWASTLMNDYTLGLNWGAKRTLRAPAVSATVALKSKSQRQIGKHNNKLGIKLTICFVFSLVNLISDSSLCFPVCHCFMCFAVAFCYLPFCFTIYHCIFVFCLCDFFLLLCYSICFVSSLGNWYWGPAVHCQRTQIK